MCYGGDGKYCNALMVILPHYLQMSYYCYATALKPDLKPKLTSVVPSYDRRSSKFCRTVHTVAIWTFPFHQNPVKKSDDFPDLTLAQYNLKK